MFDHGMVEFGALESTLDDLVDVDPVTLSDGQLHRTLVELVRQQTRLAAVTARLGAAWDHRCVWKQDGSRSAAARLARETHVAKQTAARVLKRGRALASMPHTAAAYAEAAITADHVDALIRAGAKSRARRSRFDDDEAELVRQCRFLTAGDADAMIAYWCQRVDSLLDDDGPEPTWRDRELKVGRGVGHEVHIHGNLDAVGGGEFLAALERIMHDLYLDDEATGNQRTVDQRRADALVEMARRAMAAPADARTPRPLITVLLGDWTYSRLCELSDGTIISPKGLAPYFESLDVECAFLDERSAPARVTRRRSFNRALRRLIEARDRHCQHPSGCDEPIDRCDIDHITPHSQGGETSLDNGRLQCRAHNRDSTLHNLGPANTTTHHDDPLVLAAKTRIDALINQGVTGNSPPCSRPPRRS